MRRVSKETLFILSSALLLSTPVVSLTASFGNSIEHGVTVVLIFEDCFYIEKNCLMKIVFLLFLILSANACFAQQMDSLEKSPVDTTVFTKVDIETSVDSKEWVRHLVKGLIPYIEYAAGKGMKAGKYTVLVRFLVEKDGSITDVHALNDPGFGLAKGAEEVVRTGPKWNPGEQAGKKVRSYHTQPITFVIQNK